MLNYLKWELKDYFNNKYKWFMIIGVVFLLMLVVPIKNPNAISGLIVLAYSIIMLIAMFGAYFAGTKHAVDTFSKKTFLLESMIPVSAKKILLAKYILGVFINLVYIIIIALGVGIILIKGVGLEDTFEFYKAIIEKLNFKTVLTIFTSSVFFLSIVVLGFVGAKAVNPGGKHDKITGFVFAFLLLYFTTYIIAEVMGTNSNIYITNLIYLGISTIVYFITAHLVENKLEIY